MPDTQPLEARCDHCKQTRPLFLYEADHDFHITGITCEWCRHDKQPLLCTRCWSAEKQREESTPLPAEDQAAADFFVRVCENNRRYVEQADADKAACDGIAQATNDQPA
ncbi:hypothetical protein [Streptomyces sp. NPDC054975]